MAFDAIQLANVLMPYSARKVALGKRDGLRFVHYTSADVGLRIAKSGKISLRNALAMNDYSEIQHGQICLELSLSSGVGAATAKNALDEIVPGAWDAAYQLYQNVKGTYEKDCYIFCLSEHGGGAIDEDLYGRLSMWRAYGGDTNVAIVLNNTPFFAETYAIPAFTSPVLYADETGFDVQFLGLADSIKTNAEILASAGAIVVAKVLYGAFIFSTLSTKHPGFSEEREWRIIHMPVQLGSDRIASEIVTWGGVPQKVYHVEMKNYPEEGFIGAELNEVLSEVIIGPTQTPEIIRNAYVEILEDLDVIGANERVKISGIPLRK
ncbi:MAG: DUF2971 domain-containing protein [Pseudomonadota bacterium]